MATIENTSAPTSVDLLCRLLRLERRARALHRDIDALCEELYGALTEELYPLGAGPSPPFVRDERGEGAGAGHGAADAAADSG